MNEGLYALLGAIVGGALTVGGDWMRNSNEKKARAQYLAIRCVIALETYISDCASALTNDPEAPPGTNSNDFFEMPEQFQIPDDVDWTSVPHNLSYRILSIPQRDSAARDAVRFILGVADESQARESRDEDFIKLGLDSAEIATELRRQYQLDKATVDGWDPVKELGNLKAARLKIAKQSAEAAE